MAQSFDERYEEARLRARPEGMTPEEHWQYLGTPEGRQAYDAFFEMVEERDIMRASAIDVGIGARGQDLDPDQRRAVAREADRAVDILSGVDGVTEAIVLAFGEKMAKVMAGERLRVKVLTAYELQLELSGYAEVDDGPLGRALDQATAAMRT